MNERHQGYYSIIQYCPNPARDERMNVGVALLVESKRFLQSAFLAGTQYRDIADQFPRDKTPWEVIEESAMATEMRLARIGVEVGTGKGGHNLFSFAEYRTDGPILVAKPRSVVVEGDPREKLSRLFRELVEVSNG